ncbi:hypothetical protein A0U92_06050 [Acetobacter aceti]|uniref:Uncharacterized protein n=1 Tax=Acetobacter aceti TaxID=435 RepID=A0A1U9KF92_ACEAC|nr:hypothetical protein A0U92_06050 [Acetobacter aceti]
MWLAEFHPEGDGESQRLYEVKTRASSVQEQEAKHTPIDQVSGHQGNDTASGEGEMASSLIATKQFPSP